MTTLGVDVSAYQTVSDWNAVARAGIEFAVARCVTESGAVDPSYWKHVRGARLAGLTAGAYCLLSGGMAEAQADLLIETVGDPTDMLIAVDIERPVSHPVPTVADVRSFVGYWREANPNHPVLLYGSRGSVLGQMGHLSDLGPLWLADYPLEDPAAPTVLYELVGGSASPHWLTSFGGWHSPSIWQFSCSGWVPGIRGRVDLDAIEGTDLDVLTGLILSPEFHKMPMYLETARSGRVTLKAGTTVRGWWPRTDGTGWQVNRTWAPKATDASAPFDSSLARISGTTTPSSLVHVSGGYFTDLWVSTAEVEETYDPPPCPCTCPCHAPSIVGEAFGPAPTVTSA